MDKSLKITIIGGDRRQAHLASLLHKDGHDISVLALDLAKIEIPVKKLKTIDSGACAADCIILPLPVQSDEDDVLNAPLCKNRYRLTELFSAMRSGQTVVAGRIPHTLFELAGRRGIRLYDYLEREEFAVLNAVPTAEGAIQVAMENTSSTLHGSRCLVIGYGRIGKILAFRLSGAGANVVISARKCSDLAWISAYGFEGLNTEKLSGALGGFDIVFNTAPHKILGESLLSELKDGALVIDLASMPGGVDFDAASGLGIRAIHALSLPGKVAPHSSGSIVKSTIYNILEEWGVWPND